MKHVRLGCLVGSNGSYLNTELGVCVSTLDEGTTNDGHGEVPLADNQHSDELLVSVHNEVTTQFLRLFLASNELLGGRLFEVAAVGAQHDWHLTQLTHRLHPVSVVDLVLEPGAELTTVSRMSLTALGRVDVAVLGAELVGGRDGGFFEKDFLHAHVQSVALGRPQALGLASFALLDGLCLAIEEGLGADFLQSSGQDIAVFEEGIERVDVRAN